MNSKSIVHNIVTSLRPSAQPQGEAARHARRAYRRRPFSFSQTIFIAAIVFLFLPLFVLVIYSFNSSKGMGWTGFSFVWYEQLFFHSRDLWRAFWNSILIAVTSAGTATVFGTLGAVGVGQATRRSVITSFLLILVLCYMVTRMFYDL